MDDNLIRLKRASSRLQVWVPFNERWKPAAYRLRGRYRYRSSIWSFPWENRQGVLEAIHQIYGVSMVIGEVDNTRDRWLEGNDT